MNELSWQPSLFDADEPVAFDGAFSSLVRRNLHGTAWIEHQPGWLRGADTLFAQLLEQVGWRSRSRRMYDKTVVEPRLTAHWVLDEDELPLPVLRQAATVLSERYGVAFTSVGANLYRDGADSVAWHGDRVARRLDTATVALVSLGATRPFKLRPKGGGASVTLLPGRGDLLVMGGSCQRTWDHSVPKVRKPVGPRISLQFRHAYDR